MSHPQKHDDEFWRDKLTAEQYRICREKGTERPFTGEYWQDFRAGTYLCRCCGKPLFDAATKFDAGCGWPSFYQALAGKVKYQPDTSHGMQRTEILCANCDAHLGHVFDDGPKPTGQRYCVNSVSLSFSAEDE